MASRSAANDVCVENAGCSIDWPAPKQDAGAYKPGDLVYFCLKDLHLRICRACAPCGGKQHLA
eukprot:1192828-Pleurochrysis_carterae.AAC.2